MAGFQRSVNDNFFFQLPQFVPIHYGVRGFDYTTVKMEYRLQKFCTERTHGCFEKLIYISLPDIKTRQCILKLHLGDTPNDLIEEDFGDMALVIKKFYSKSVEVRRLTMSERQILEACVGNNKQDIQSSAFCLKPLPY